MSRELSELDQRWITNHDLRVQIIGLSKTSLHLEIKNVSHVIKMVY